MPVFFTNYSKPPQVKEDNFEASKTMQQFKDEADINVLIGRYMRTGFYYNPLTTPVSKRAPSFDDYSEIGDFQTQQQKILDVYDHFATLPAKVREQFNNNPALFVEFVGNPDNLNKCIEMGIFEAEKTAVPPAPAENIVVPTPAPIEPPTPVAD